MTVKRRLVGLLLVVFMVGTVIPANVFATEDSEKQLLSQVQKQEKLEQAEALTETVSSDKMVLASLTEAVSGYCGGEGDGTNLTWTFDPETRFLSIEGTGAMKDYPSYSTVDLPWLNVVSVKIGDGVTTIGNHAFDECSSLQNVEISNSVTSIGQGAFLKCYSLHNIVLPDGLTSMGNFVFMDCTNLRQITIPKSLKKIGFRSFYYCDNLREVKIPEGVETIGKCAFYGCQKLKSIQIPASVTSIESEAFKLCGNPLVVIFKGNPPRMETNYYAPFINTSVTFHYLTTSEGWTTPTWYGFRTLPIYNQEDYSQTNFTEYYKKITRYRFTFKNITTGNYLNNVTVEWKGNTYDIGEQHSLDMRLVDAAPDDVVVFRCAGYRTEERAIKELQTIQKILFYPTDYVSTPVLKRCIASKDDGATFTSLVSDYAYFTLTAGDTLETLVMESSVYWFEHETGKMYLSQTLEPRDGVEIKDAEPIKVSHLLTAYKPVYLLLVTPDGTVYPEEIPIYVVEPKTEEEDIGKKVKLDLGEDITIPEQEDGFLKQFKFGMQMLDSAKLTLSVEDDGTVYGLIGVEIENEDSIRGIVESFEDEEAMSNIGDYAASVDSLKEFIKSKEKGGIFALEPPKSRTFVIEAEAQAVGYIKGKWNGGKMVFTECKVGLFVAGKMEWVWQFTAPNGAPFFFTLSLAPEMELATNLLSNHDGSLLFLADPLDFKGEVAAKGSAGLGVEGTVGVAAYTKGGFVTEGQIPVKDDNAKIYVNLTVGVEAELFCWEADLEIWRSNNLYIHGGPDTANLQLLAVEEGEMEWKEQSRDYLHHMDLLAVDGSNTETTGEVVFNNVYTYANVQLTELGSGTRILVWTADPGTREVANNRTVLYYAYYNGECWSQPMPVETEDDGTGDFNPVLKTLDGTAYLFWQDASRPLTDEDTVSTTYGLMDISCAVFDSYNRNFVSMGTVGTEYYDGAVSAVLAAGVPVIAWTSNSNENPLAADKADAALCFAMWNDTTWKQTTVAEGLGTIDQIAFDLNKLGIWFSADTDYDGTTVSDKEIFFIDIDLQLQQITDNDVADTKPECVNGTTVWYSAGEVVCGEETITLAENTDRYQYLNNNNGLEALVYVVTDSETRLSNLYASINDGSGWGEPIRLDGGNGNIGSFSAQFASSGTLSIAVRERLVSGAVADDELPKLSVGSQLKLYTVTPICDLVLENTTYLAHTLIPEGTLSVQVNLKNAGMAAIDNVLVTVKNGANVLAENAFSTELLSGAQEVLFMPVPMPEKIPDELTVEVNAVGYQEGKAEDNTAALPLRVQDISLEGAEAYSDGAATEVVALVVNRGRDDVSGVTVSLKDQKGNVLSAQNELALSAGAGEFITFILDKTFENNTVLCIEAAGLEEENIKANNHADVLIAAETEGEISLSANCLETDAGLNVIVEIENTTKDNATFVLYCAAYREDGKMLCAKELTGCETAFGAVHYQQVTFTEDVEEIDRVQVFRLDNVYCPMQETVEVLAKDN